MEARLKWLRIVTLANVAVAALLIAEIYAVMSALAAFAAFVSTGPLYTVLSIGVVLSVVALTSTRSVASHTSRRIGYLVNGCVGALYSAIVIATTASFIAATEERFVVPEGYKGDIYVIYGAVDGEPEHRTFRRVTYRIPQDGILRTRGAIVPGLTRTGYYYELNNGRLRRIQGLWLTTIPRTAQNLANDKDLGVFFPRSGTATDAAGCKVEFEQLYVGTKANLLSNNQEKDLFQYLRDHPVGCVVQSR